MKKIAPRMEPPNNQQLWKKKLIVYSFLLITAVSLKVHYSNSSVENLAWIIAPTVKLVEAFSTLDFTKEAFAGYVNIDHRFIIAKSCAGINFLIIVFCLMVVSYQNRFQTTSQGLFHLAGSFLFAYCITLVANSVRILGAVFLHSNSFSFGWFSSSRIHRLEGIVIYFVFLLLVYGFIQKSKNPKKRKIASGTTLMNTPIFWYLLITVILPLATRLYRKEFSGYFEHSVFVIGVVFLIHIIFRFFKWIIDNFRSKVG